MNNQVSDVCTGCGACESKCPQSAVKFVLNERKEYVAVINKNKCVECNLCRMVCPQIYKPELHSPKETYCAWAKNQEDYSTTSSGGIATLMSKYMIKEGGIIYGAAFIEGENIVRHIRVDNVAGLELLKGSKYIQSDFRAVFYQIKEDIQRGKKVLVIGLPCQIAAIRNAFINKTKNLYLVDMVCHGVPAEEYFKDYLSTICSNTDSVTVTFRKKRCVLKVYKNKKNIYSSKYELDPYYRSFMNGLIFRENCYTCAYAQNERAGDITVCDFWGIDRKKTNLQLPEFVSCVMVNTEKGKTLFENIKSECYVEPRDLDEAVAGNTNLRHASIKHKDRDCFIDMIKSGKTFIEAVNETSIHDDIIKCKIMDIIKAPYRKIKYGKWIV